MVHNRIIASCAGSHWNAVQETRILCVFPAQNALFAICRGCQSKVDITPNADCKRSALACTNLLALHLYCTGPQVQTNTFLDSVCGFCSRITVILKSNSKSKWNFRTIFIQSSNVQRVFIWMFVWIFTSKNLRLYGQHYLYLWSCVWPHELFLNEKIQVP